MDQSQKSRYSATAAQLRTLDRGRNVNQFLNGDFMDGLYECLCQIGSHLSDENLFKSDTTKEGIEQASSWTKFPFNVNERAIYTKHEFDAVIHRSCDQIKILNEIGNEESEVAGGTDIQVADGVTFIGF